MIDTYDYDRNPDLYRARAKKMRELAVDALNQQTKAELIKLAADFDRLANSVERRRASFDHASGLPSDRSKDG